MVDDLQDYDLNAVFKIKLRLNNGEIKYHEFDSSVISDGALESDEDNPVKFKSKREAQKTLDLFLQEEQEAFYRGYIEEPYFRADYRIVRTDNAKE